MKKFFYGIVCISIVCLVAVLGFAFWPTKVPSLEANINDLNQPSIIEHGKYLAILGDCAACHSKAGSPDFAGGDGIASPIGTIYAANITPDDSTGIGQYSLNDFNKAVRYGIRKDGVSLYPAMPYPSYASISDDDIKALYAYFRFGVAPVRSVTLANEIAWPLSIRWPLAIWRKLFAPQTSPYLASRYRDDAVIARGAYIVQGLAHCGTCHTPRAITLQEKALNEENPLYLSGGTVIDGWITSNLHDNSDGLKNWSEDDLIAILSNGRNSKGVVIGRPMNDFITQSGSHWKKEDLQAVARYLKTLEPLPRSASHYTPVDQPKSVGADESAVNFLYQSNCAACHGRVGEGIGGIFPALAGNITVLAPDPQSVIRLVLTGFSTPKNAKAQVPLAMPGFADRLNDNEIAKILTYVRQNWGNNAPQVSASNVEAVRNTYVK